MRNKKNKKSSLWKNKHLRYIVATMMFSSIIYYLPVLGGLIGWDSFERVMDGFHNLFGIDVLGLLFFAPVVYVAYVLGVIPAVLTALVAMIIIFPHAILEETFPVALFKPTAFVIILSAVGAAVAMLQKSEQQYRQRIREMKCLYKIGKAAEESQSTDEFLTKIVNIIPRAINCPDKTKVVIHVGDKVFTTANFQRFSRKITEYLVNGSEKLGCVEIYSIHDNPYLKKRNHLIRTLAERISGAIRELELEQSLQDYYAQLKDEVEKRTKDLEQAQEKLIRSERLAAVGELASSVGHELRNPLNVIRNCVYLLNMSLSEKGDKEGLNTLKLLDKQVDTANNIVTDLLDFTRIRPPASKKTDLNRLIKESLSLVTIPEQVSVGTNFNGHSIDVKIDPEQISRVFINLVSNAIQAMDSNGELRINNGTENGHAWIQFTDTGCGIPEENLEKIFEPLFTTKPRDIGLGLAISKKLVEQNGGKIEVISQTGKGTTFTVKLPVEKGSEPEHDQ